MQYFHDRPGSVIGSECRSLRDKLARSFLLCLAVALISGQAHGQPDASPVVSELKSYSCVVHLHSRISGEQCYELPFLTELARSNNVDAIFLADNLTATIQYGLPPLRNLLWYSKSFPSVAEHGAQHYVDEVDAENSRQSDVLYVPGVEMCPRFYWTGSFRNGDLTVHDHQRNILVLGTRDAEFLTKSMETCGYLWGRDTWWIIAGRLIIIAAALSLVAFAFLPGFLARRTEFRTKEVRASFVPGLFLPLVVIAAIFNMAASTRDRFDIYGARAGAETEQQFIDQLNERNLVHYVAHPEAHDDHEFSYSPIGIMPVKFKVHTDPYPELLSETHGYTGFGGVYQGKNTLIEPGGRWDNLLLEYLAGKRGNAPWCFGEMLYHYEGQAGDKSLKDVETVVWAPECTEEALLDALRAGRFYARRNSKTHGHLILDEWAIGEALSGETFESDGGEAPVSLKVSSSDPGEPVTVQIIRNGEVLTEQTGTTPMDVKLKDTPPDGEKAFYRVLVKGQNIPRLVTNPIFVR